MGLGLSSLKRDFQTSPGGQTQQRFKSYALGEAGPVVRFLWVQVGCVSISKYIGKAEGAISEATFESLGGSSLSRELPGSRSEAPSSQKACFDEYILVS